MINNEYYSNFHLKAKNLSCWNLLSNEYKNKKITTVLVTAIKILKLNNKQNKKLNKIKNMMIFFAVHWISTMEKCLKHRLGIS